MNGRLILLFIPHLSSQSYILANIFDRPLPWPLTFRHDLSSWWIDRTWLFALAGAAQVLCFLGFLRPALDGKMSSPVSEEGLWAQRDAASARFDSGRDGGDILGAGSRRASFPTNSVRRRSTSPLSSSDNVSNMPARDLGSRPDQSDRIRRLRMLSDRRRAERLADEASAGPSASSVSIVDDSSAPRLLLDLGRAQNAQNAHASASSSASVARPHGRPIADHERILSQSRSTSGDVSDDPSASRTAARADTRLGVSRSAPGAAGVVDLTLSSDEEVDIVFERVGAARGGRPPPPQRVPNAEAQRRIQGERHTHIPLFAFPIDTRVNRPLKEAAGSVSEIGQKLTRP